MPEVLDNPVIQDQSAAALKAALDAHSNAAKAGAVEPGIWDPMAALKEAPVVKAEEPKKEEPKQEAEKPKVEEVKAVEITHETSDEDLNKKVDAEAKQYGLSKAAKVHLANMSFAAREAKRQIKQQTEPLQTELETTKAELAKFKDKAPNSDATQAIQKKLEEAQRRIDEQETELGAANIKKTKLYVDEVATPMKELTDEFKALAADREVTADALIELANMKGLAKDAKFDELTEGWSGIAVGELTDLLKRHGKLIRHQTQLEAGGKQRYDAWLVQQREAGDVEKAKAASERAAVLPTIWEKAVLSAVPSLKDVNGELGEKIKAVQSFIQQADGNWLPKQTAYDQARVFAQAGAFPVVVTHYEARLAESAAKLADAEKQIKELTGAIPGAAGSGVVKQEQAGGDTAGKAAWDNLFAR
jgi:hypothetical protein